MSTSIALKFIFSSAGPSAGRLELDFSKLVAGGILHSPTISIRGVYPDPDRKKKVPYRTCGGLEEEDILKELEGECRNRLIHIIDIGSWYT